MAEPRRFQLFLLLLVMIIVAVPHQCSSTRPISIQNHQLGNSKMLATLGIVCKCCDGESGKCRSTWDGSCSKLQCLPWKFH
ncbi:hypothetical protein CICLE_v10033223mg [Citrus x clementina]|uniref:Embryo surrounding factor 1 brassicaceae domain-containing protein n=1 Tax=Citrus clementina TaxID=85681 RepID=V4TGJ5_CITCL|nr:hypothetical protein CICLE_v10033223mg [Citrus x clementina]